MTYRKSPPSRRKQDLSSLGYKAGRQAARKTTSISRPEDSTRKMRDCQENTILQQLRSYLPGHQMIPAPESNKHTRLSDQLCVPPGYLGLLPNQEH